MIQETQPTPPNMAYGLQRLSLMSYWKYIFAVDKHRNQNVSEEQNHSPIKNLVIALTNRDSYLSSYFPEPIIVKGRHLRRDSS